MSLPWAERVFHVLAHVRATAHLAPSVYDAVWIAFAEAHLGPASDRTLSEDAAALGALATTHDALARIQHVAWLFDSPEHAATCADRELSALRPEDVGSPHALRALVDAGAAAEVLRAAAELEDLSALPPPRGSFSDVTAGVRARAGAAPTVATMEIEGVRSLRLRGRVRDRRIWVGVPDDDLPPLHPTWQALHEATLAEVHACLAALPHAPLEHAAVVLLAERAVRAGLSDEHGTWFSHFGGRAPSTNRATLPEAVRRFVRDRLER